MTKLFFKKTNTSFYSYVGLISSSSTEKVKNIQIPKNNNMVCKWLTVMSKQLENVYKYQHYCFHFLITNLMQM